MKVLIVDDSITVRSFIRLILKEESDIEIVGEAVNGREAVRLSMTTIPDIILMDIHMPVMDGVEAIARIKEWQPSMRIVVLTADRSDMTEHKARSIGALHVLPKPSMSWSSNGVRNFCRFLKILAKKEVTR